MNVLQTLQTAMKQKVKADGGKKNTHGLSAGTLAFWGKLVVFELVKTQIKEKQSLPCVNTAVIKVL